MRSIIKFFNNFFVNALFLYILIFFSFNNKILLLLFALFLTIFYKKTKNLTTSLFILYILFLPFEKGKSIFITLIPAWILQTNIPYDFSFIIAFSDIALMGILYLLLKERINNKENLIKLRLEKNEIFLMGFLLFSLISIYFSQNYLVSFLAFLKLIRYGLVFFIIKKVSSKNKIPKILPFILAAGLFFQGSWASLQFVLQRPLGRAIEPVGAIFSAYGQTAAEERSFYRSQGTFDHPNTLAAFLIINLSFILIKIFDNEESEQNRKIFLLSFLMGFLGLIFSASRASWAIFLLITILEIIYLKHINKLSIFPFLKKIIYLALPGTFILLFFVILPRLNQFIITLEEYGGFYYRNYLMEKAWYLSLEAPLGIGLGTFPLVLMQRFGFFTWPAPVHNLLLEILVEAGIFSLLFFLLFAVLSYKKFIIHTGFLKNKLRIVKIGAFFASLCFLLVAQFYPFFLSSKIFEYFWLFMGIMLY